MKITKEDIKKIIAEELQKEMLGGLVDKIRGKRSPEMGYDEHGIEAALERADKAIEELKRALEDMGKRSVVVGVAQSILRQAALTASGLSAKAPERLKSNIERLSRAMASYESNPVSGPAKLSREE